MFNPGYVLVDCSGLNLLSQEAQTISGIYNLSKAAYESGKQIVACNCEYGEGVHMSPVPVMAIEEAGVYIFTASILQVRVASSDAVTVVSLLG